MNASIATSSFSVADDGNELLQRGRVLFKYLDQCLNALPKSRYSTLCRELKQKSTIELKNIEKPLMPDIRADVEQEFRDLLDDGKVVPLLNKLDRIQEEQKKFGDEYKRTPKWRPYGVPVDDLRPYGVRELRAYRQRLISTKETLERENKKMATVLLQERRTIKNNVDTSTDLLSKCLDIKAEPSNLVDYSLLGQINS